MQTHQFQFAHHRLEVYRLAMEQLEAVHGVSRKIPRGYRNTADQVLRAAGGTVGLIGEGANRYTQAQKRQRFVEARGEAGEVAVHIEAGVGMGVVEEAEGMQILHRANRICAMLTGLIRRHG